MSQGMFDTDLAYHEPTTKQNPCTYNKIHNKKGRETMVFYPTYKELSDFSAYVTKIEESGAHLQSGIAKIVPPQDWHPRPSRMNDYSDVEQIVLKCPIEEEFKPCSAQLYEKGNKTAKCLTVEAFRKKALSKEYANPDEKAPVQIVVDNFWNSVGTGSKPIYGADQDGSIYDKDVTVFNMNSLGTCLDLLKENEVSVKGVNTCYLYFGMYRTTFPWHAEDVDLYSVNYLHFGAPKFWYAVSSEYAERFERLVSQLFIEASIKCDAFLRHKTSVFLPEVLTQHNIPYSTMVQYPGEAIITFPQGYHMGFNMGYNCAESTNFAIDRWIDYGKTATTCRCMSRQEGVKIDMVPFMKKFRNDEYNFWHEYWYGDFTTLVAKPLKALGETLLRKLQLPSVKKRSKSKENTKWVYKCDMSLLWSDYTADFRAERAFNLMRAQQAPYCAVCQYFMPDQCAPCYADNEPFNILQNSHSQRLVVDTMFEKGMKQEECRNNINRNDARRLKQCTDCKVVVHTGCYPTDSNDDWRCLRCQEENEAVKQHASCHLCKMRGGALIKAQKGLDTGLFVHMICAIVSRLTWFPNPSAKNCAITEAPRRQNSIQQQSPVDPHYRNPFSDQKYMKQCIEGVFECDLCHRNGEGLMFCTKCDETRPSFCHVTCAKAAGLTLQRRDWPIEIAVICLKDQDAFADANAPIYGELVPGDKVTAWIDEGAVVENGIVNSVHTTECCAVEFTDGTCSIDVDPADIVWCAW